MPTWPLAMEEPENTRISPRTQSRRLVIFLNWPVERQAIEVMYLTLTPALRRQ